MYSHCFRMSGRWEIVLATQVCRACWTSFELWNVCCSESQCFAESCQKRARRNSGVISRKSGVISRTPAYFSGLTVLKVLSLKRFWLEPRVLIRILGGRGPEANQKILESNPLCKRASETRLQRKRGSLSHTPWFVLGSLCLGTSLLIICCEGSALRHFRRWARAMGTGRLQWLGCGMTVFQKNDSWRKGSLLVYDPSGFFTILDPDVFSGRRRRRHFFRSPAQNFAGLRSGTFFSLKEDPGILYIYIYINS